MFFQWLFRSWSSTTPASDSHFTSASAPVSASVPQTDTTPNVGTTHFGFPLPPTTTAPRLAAKPVFVWRCFYCKTTNETIGNVQELHDSWKHAKCAMCKQILWHTPALLLEVMMRDVEDGMS